MNNTFISFCDISTCLPSGGSIYFAGIGGVSMAGLASLAATRGYHVRGCDRNLRSESITRLLLDHIPVETEAEADPHGAHLLVYSLAISDTSPVISLARAYGIPLISRANLLAFLTHGYKNSIAVAGMHGKSTTVGMLSAILTDAGLSPTVLSGAPLAPGGDPLIIGTGDLCLAEACEYRDSFLSLRPTLGVVTNIELDHPDYFSTLSAVEHSFSRFLSQCDEAVIGYDCLALRSLAPPNATSFGFSPNATLQAVMCPDGADLLYRGEHLGRLRLSVTGTYNYQNALAAALTAIKLGVPFPIIRDALASFRGVGRRMERVGRVSAEDGGDADVYLDYAHHPTELTAVITAARERGKRVLAVFQPHTYSRTQALWQSFIAAIRLADFMVLTDIYAAREAAICGVSSSILAQEAGVSYASSFASAAHMLRSAVRDGDILLILGAGDIDRMVPFLCDIGS